MALHDLIDPMYIIPIAAVVMAIALWKRSPGSQLPPGPRRYPVVGNLPQLKGDDKLYVKLNELRRSHGDIVFLCLGAVKMLVLFGHRKVKAVLEAESEEFKYRPQWLVEIKSLELSKGIVWSNGSYNQCIRAFALPALYPGVGSMTVEERVQAEASIVMDTILENGGKPIRLFQNFHRAICNINCGVIFGFRYEYSNRDFFNLICLMDQLLQRQGIKNPLNFFPILQNLPEGRKVKETKDVLDEIKSFIKAELNKAKETFTAQHTRSLLDLYIARTQKPAAADDDEITEESVFHIIRDLFVAGSENVAIGLQWLVAYMIRYPDVQRKCRTLLTQTINDKDTVSMNDMHKLVYIEATVNEVLRLANIAPLSVPHATIKECTIEDYQIPKDTMVITHLESVHLDPEFWQEPERFDPERFIGEDGELLKKEAFYPFSTGPRYCLAERLARMELLITFCTLLQRVTFTSPEGTEPPSLQGIQPGAFVEPPPFDVCCLPVAY